MKLTLPTLATALTAVAADTAPDASGKSYLPSAYVHNMGMKALKKARADVVNRVKSNDRKLLRSTSSNRKLVDGSDADLDFESLMGDMMGSMGSVICAALEWGQDLAAEFEVDLESGVDIDSNFDGVDDVNVVCDDFGCDDPDAEVPNLIMNCNMEGEVCEEYDGVEYCATDASINHKMSLNLTGISYSETTQCNTFTKPANLVDEGRFCFTIFAEIDYGSLLSFDNMFSTETQNADDAGLDDFFQITSCSGTYDDSQAECECEICNDDMGFDLKCGDLMTEECTNYDTTEVGAVAEGGPETPSVAVLRLIELPNTDGVTVVSDIDAEGSTDSGAPDESGNDSESEAGDGSSPDAETTVEGENTDSEAGDSDANDVAGTESTPETTIDEGNDNPETSATGDADSGTTDGDNVDGNASDLPIGETGTDATDVENTEETGSSDEDVVAKADTADDTSPAASRSGLVAASLALVFASSLYLV